MHLLSSIFFEDDEATGAGIIEPHRFIPSFILFFLLFIFAVLWFFIGSRRVFFVVFVVVVFFVLIEL